MKSLGLGRYALCSCVAAALLAACGGSQPPIDAAAFMPAIAAGPRATHPGHSWMLKEASSEALLYITGSQYVYVVSYPKGELVGELSDIDAPSGVCSDTKGDVFVTAVWTEDVLEFAHGGTSPIAKLGDYGYYPNGCAVDPATGNLAVANFNSMDGSGGNLAIYSKAQGKPTDYTAPGFGDYYWCAYDNQGNLLVDGNGSGYAEMPAGGSTLNEINLNLAGEGIQWDGTYFAIVDPSAKQVNRVTISGSSGIVVSTVHFTGLIASLGYDFVIAGSKIVLPYTIKKNGSFSKVAMAKYPHGGRLGKPFKIGGLDYYAMTLSN
jgi:hypothetical protein